MADITLPQQDGFSRSISDTPPNHYTMKIQSFSQLAKNKIDAYHSSDFEAGGYKWKLVVHPNGNEDKGITDHISVYLVITQVESLNLGWEIRATFRLFLLDQNKDNYFTLEDIAGKRFRRMKLEWGFDTFVPLALFNDLEKGYLVKDTCVFGADVYVTHEKHTGKGEILSMIKDAISYKHTWKINNFSTLNDECLDSEPFNAADQTWKIQVYPKGKGSGKNNFVSVYLALAEPEKLSPATKIYAEFTIYILDQINGKNYFGTANYWFSGKNCVRGWPRFVSASYFNMQLAGLLVKNSCFMEAEVTVHGMANEL
ncbi:MATH domain and coiled-coil domain-containing protein At2g42460-like isoform X2 [Olea europaea var. sylvestris]|uniref:RESTRICTED TEV MOVEMENT 3-like n=1 Tax=Olea europaea subsp. europaea TaxID=158383 RepID=A0A8S0S9T9_OLEEU|nr:MATH domain and coiled-coil domain-containing protein At2g42460-like isoform X2 [Olea europaea var. sylvestris]CAA2988877.1 RESTRICTED TEV MOVEMENT 3-like [Olea europaea subsp. europaea]